MVVSCGDDKYLPRIFQALFTFDKYMRLPDLNERYMLAEYYLKNIQNSDNFVYIINEIVKSTPGNTPRVIYLIIFIIL